MTTTCSRCSSQLDEASLICPNCGTVATMPSEVAEATPTMAPVFTSFDHRNDLEGIGGWLILPAIGLAVAPFIALHGIFIVDMPVLTGSRYQAYLSDHPRFVGLLIFEIMVNSFFLLGSLGLNFLLYKKKRIFPKCIIGYLAIQLCLILADHLGVIALLPSADSSGGLKDVFRAFSGAAIWIPYFLTSQRVKATFVN